MSNHPIVHVEISALDREASGKFYSDMFGWNIHQLPEMDYATFDYGVEGVGGGLNPVREDNPAGTVVIYVDTDDIDGDLVKAEELGGKIVTQKTEIPGMGWFGIFTDPTGNPIGLYTAMQNNNGSSSST